MSAESAAGGRVYRGGAIFDGQRLLRGRCALFEDGRLSAFVGADELPRTATVVDLDGDILSPGFVDLQVNGGGGVMFNDDPSPETLRRIAGAHRGLGTTWLLPTLITDTADRTRAAIDAAIAAVERGVPGIGGLHLEGPHLAAARRGAHDAALIRPMADADLRQLLAAAARLPALMVTLAPESATREQVSALARAGVIVSLGHSDADYRTGLDYVRAGARCATHLFNAMSPLGSRAPGLVGTALSSGQVSAGLIADGIHVHPEVMRIAWAAKRPPGRIFLVSDAMAVAGTGLREFELQGRRVLRADGCLRLEDGTLAGADLDLATALRVLVEQAGIDTDAALRAATSAPWALLGRGPRALRGLAQTGFIRIRRDLGRAAPLEDA